MQISPNTGISFSRRQDLLLAGLTLIITAVLIIAISGQPDYYLLTQDEYLTLDRSRSISANGLWLRPESNQVPLVGRKPPLQYWITALFMKTGLPDFISMRLVSVLFFSGLLWSMFLLCESLRPGNLELKLMTLFLGISSPALIRLAVTGLLDVGHGFFLMLTVASVFLSKRDAKWWYLACLGWSLGFLQKSPIALVMAVYLVVGLSFVLKKGGFQFQKLIRNRHFLKSWIGGIIICLAYIVLKWQQYGTEFFEEAFLRQTIERFIPALPDDPERHRGWGFIFYHLIQDGLMLWITSFTMLIGLILFKRRILSGKEWAILIYIGAVLLIFVMSGGAIYFRYMSVWIPFVVVMVSVALVDLIKFKLIRWILIATIFAFSIPIYQRACKEWKSELPADETYHYYIHLFKSKYDPDYQPVVIHPRHEFQQKIYMEALVYYLNAPYEILQIVCGEDCDQKIQQLVPEQSYFIVSEKRFMSELDSLMNRETTYYVDSKYVIWKGSVK